MGIRFFTAENRNTIEWSGGTSTELFLHPQGGSFAERRFQFRISTATVVADTATFTRLEGVTRHLMIINGNLELTHEGHYSKYLQPYEQDTFPGEWTTHSKGAVTDFNLMLKDGLSGSLQHIRLEKNQGQSFAATTLHYFLYLVTGKATTQKGDVIKATDLLQIELGGSLYIEATDPCHIIVIAVHGATNH